MNFLKKVVSLFLITVFTVSLTAFAGSNTSKTTTSGAEALIQLQQLGIMNKLSKESDDLNKKLTREEFAKILVNLLNLNDTADSMMNQSMFADVKLTDTNVGYINAVVNKGYLSAMTDRKFLPQSNVTFSQFCTALVKTLGYVDSDLAGIWPQNFITKAKSLKLSEGITLKNSDGVPRWVAALMLDRLQNCYVKKTNSQDANLTLTSSIGLFTDCIVFGNASTMNDLEENEVMTDQGTFYLEDSSQKLLIGAKYRLKIIDNKIEKVSNSIKKLKKISISTNAGVKITFKDDNNKTQTMTLPTNVTYYYNGVKQSYNNLSNLLQSDSTIIFAYNDNMTGYSYAVIADPIYSKPVTAYGVKAGETSIGSIHIEAGMKILKNGSFIDVSKIQDGDLVYMISTIDNTEKYIYVIDNKIEGRLTGIFPNRLYPKTIQIDDKSYEISTDMDIDKITSDGSIYNIGDTVQILIGHDSKVADISKTVKVGKAQDYIILSNSITNESLQENQIMTDKGLLYMKDIKMKLILGTKYNLYLTAGEVETINTTMNDVKNITVNNANDYKITYKNGNNTETMTLPDSITYYYNGEKQAYSNIKNLMQVNTTIIFGYNGNKTGYDYAVIVDPIYSKPEIAANVQIGDQNIGSISLTDWCPVVRNGEYINAYAITNGEIVYKVSDLYNTSKYLLVLDGIVTGKITAILPSRVLPKIIQIDNRNYDISYSMDITKLSSKNSTFMIGDTVQLTIGFDSKVINVDYPAGQDNADYAYVINSSLVYENGLPVYGVKLLKADGTTKQYETNVDYSALRGTVVVFKEIDDDTVTLTSKESSPYPDIAVNKEEGKIGDYYVSSNVRIFNVINNYNGIDNVAKVISWNDLYSGTIQNTKIQFMNHTGVFGDVNVILINDLYNEGKTFGIVKSATTSQVKTGNKFTTMYNYSFYINGKDYSFSSSDAYNLGAMNVASLELYNNQILSCNGVVADEVDTTFIQGIDSTKIKLKDKIYKYSNDIKVYYKNSASEISTKLVSEIDITKTYTSVKVYLDRPLTYGGKIKAIVISE